MPFSPAAKKRKKEAFLKELRGQAFFHTAAERVGINRKTIWAWRKEDSEFELAVEAAQNDAIETLEASMYERALNLPDPQTGKRPFDERTAALCGMFIIKAHRPAYKDTFKADIDVGEVKFTFQIPQPGTEELPTPRVLELPA